MLLVRPEVKMPDLGFQHREARPAGGAATRAELSGS